MEKDDNGLYITSINLACQKDCLLDNILPFTKIQRLYFVLVSQQNHNKIMICSIEIETIFKISQFENSIVEMTEWSNNMFHDNFFQII